MSDAQLQALRSEMHDELTERILPFWMIDAADLQFGGAIGLIDEDGTPNAQAPKGCILHARILWTFSAAYRALGIERYRVAADRMAVYFTAQFIDPTYGGAFWMVDVHGRPLDERKHIYAQAFAVYALAEHFSATGDVRSRDSAIALHRLSESHAYDEVRGGYEEAFSRDWKLLDDVRLSASDANERKSMNTHLHVLEAYTSLYKAWPDARLGSRIRTLLELFLDRIIAPGGDHVVSFFTDTWEPRSTRISFGHDIETSWLLVEGALAIGDAELTERVQRAADRLAEAVLLSGFDDEYGGLFNERADGRLDTDKEWWPQAEAIVGFLCAYQSTGSAPYLDAALRTWGFVSRHVVDRSHGEWYRRVSRSGDTPRGGEKVGPWKCPYHNGRACLEVLARVPAPSSLVTSRSS